MWNQANNNLTTDSSVTKTCGQLEKTSLMILLATKGNSGLVATLQKRESVDKINFGVSYGEQLNRRMFLASKRWIENCKRKAAQMT